MERVEWAFNDIANPNECLHSLSTPLHPWYIHRHLTCSILRKRNKTTELVQTHTSSIPDYGLRSHSFLWRYDYNTLHSSLKYLTRLYLPPSHSGTVLLLQWNGEMLTPGCMMPLLSNYFINSMSSHKKVVFERVWHSLQHQHLITVSQSI